MNGRNMNSKGELKLSWSNIVENHLACLPHFLQQVFTCFTVDSREHRLQKTESKQKQNKYTGDKIPVPGR